MFGAYGGLLVHFEGVLRASGRPLGGRLVVWASWGPLLRPSWVRLGPSWDASWVVLGRSWAVVGPS